jgi:hypothetical protein
MIRVARRIAVSSALALAAIFGFAAAMAHAEDGAYSGALVRGGAPLPQFQLNFPSSSGLHQQALPAGDLEIALTSPNKGVFSFLFSPRAQIGRNSDEATGTSRNLAGLNWNVFQADRFYGGFGFSGSFINPQTDDPLHRAVTGSPLALHGTLQLGYQLGEQQNLSLSFDRARNSDFSTDRGELGDNFRLGYGLRF